MKATEKQVGYACYLLRQRGTDPNEYVNAASGKAAGLSMRERSGAGRWYDYLCGCDRARISSIITALSR